MNINEDRKFGMENELSDDELEAVVGGVSIGDDVSFPQMDICPYCWGKPYGTTTSSFTQDGKKKFVVRLGCCGKDYVAVDYSLKLRR